MPECPDYFYWKRWYYLVYSDNSNTYYVKSRHPYGPWEEPGFEALNEDWANVVKTGEFTGGRRIAAAWIPSRAGDKDNGEEIFGGNMVFRELTQDSDGTLNTKFPLEMIPESGNPITLKLSPDSYSKVFNNNSFIINAPNGVGAVNCKEIPMNCRITLEIDPKGINEDYGIYLRSYNKAIGGYKLDFSAINQRVSLGNTSIDAVTGLNRFIKVDIIMKGDIIDVCIDNRRCIVNRTPEQKGNFLWFYARHGKVNFKSIKVRPLL